jgi:hypothetical protein
MEKAIKLEKNRQAKKAREEWLASATSEELNVALTMKRVGPMACEYIIHPVYGRINRSHIVEKLLSIGVYPTNEVRTPIERNEEYYEKRLYALHISNKKARLEILQKNYKEILSQHEANKADETLQYKLVRILEEIKKIQGVNV